jgi:hypothetical protein
MDIRFTLAPQPVMLMDGAPDGFALTREKATSDAGADSRAEDKATKSALLSKLLSKRAERKIQILATPPKDLSRDVSINQRRSQSIQVESAMLYKESRELRKSMSMLEPTPVPAKEPVATPPPYTAPPLPPLANLSGTAYGNKYNY